MFVTRLQTVTKPCYLVIVTGLQRRYSETTPGLHTPVFLFRESGPRETLADLRQRRCTWLETCWVIIGFSSFCTMGILSMREPGNNVAGVPGLWKGITGTVSLTDGWDNNQLLFISQFASPSRPPPSPPDPLVSFPFALSICTTP